MSPPPPPPLFPLLFPFPFVNGAENASAVAEAGLGRCVLYRRCGVFMYMNAFDEFFQVEGNKERDG